MRRCGIEATGGFFLLLAWLLYLDQGLVVPLALAACALHELGHWAAIRLLGGDIRRVRLTAVGAEMVLARPLGYWQEGLAALAGPGVNLLLALAASFRRGGALFSGLNLVLGCFNLLPVGRLDGGRALYCTLALAAGQDAADRAGAALDRLLLLLLTAGGLLLLRAGNGTLLLVALWLVLQNRKKGGNRACQTAWKRLK